LQKNAHEKQVTMLRLDSELADRLGRAAQLQRTSTHGLARMLLERGLTRETQSRRARATLAALTPREREVVWLILRGHTNRQIAAALYISTETVKTHIRHVLEKFDAPSKADLRLRLRQLDLEPGDHPTPD